MRFFDNQDGSALTLVAVGVLAAAGVVTSGVRGGANQGSAAKKGHAAVASAWSNGRPKSGGGFLTDGNNLFSYDLQIGTTDGDGNKVVYDYSAATDNFRSATTSAHVGAAKQVADLVVDPGRVSLLG